MIWNDIDAFLAMLNVFWPFFVGVGVIATWEVFLRVDGYWYGRKLRKEDESRSKVSDELREFYKRQNSTSGNHA